MAENDERILDIKINYNDAIRKIAEYRTKLDELKESESDLRDELKSGTISREEYNLRMAESKVQSQQYTEVIRTTTKAVQNQLKVEKEKEGSLKALRAELSNATAAYDELSRAEREGAKGKELQAHINKVTDELKEAEEATKRYYRNVGNYEESLAPLFQSLESKLERQKQKYEQLVQAQGANSKAAKKQKKAIEDTQLQLDLFGDAAEKASGDVLGFISAGVGLDASLIKAAQQLGSLTEGAKKAAAGVKLLGKQMLALMANPVVAFLGLVAAALMAVVKGITSSETNTNRWAKAMAPFNRLLNEGIRIVQEFAGAILYVVEGGGKLLGWLSKVSEKLPVVGKHFAESNKQMAEAIELEKEKIAIEQQSRKDEVQNAKDALAVSELRTKAKDKEKYSAEERLKYVQEANRLEEEQAKRNVDLAERRLKALQIESEWADNDAATNEELARLEAEVYNKRREYFDKTRELLEQENTIKQENQAAAKAEMDAAKAAYEKGKEIRAKELEEVRNAEDEMLKLVQDDREKQRIEIERNYNRQIEDLKLRLRTEADLTTSMRQSIKQQITAIEQQKVNDLKKLSDDELKAEIEQKKQLIEAKLEAVKEGTEQEYQLEMQRLITMRDAELANTELTEEMKLAIREKYNKQMDDLITSHQNDIYQKQQDAMRVQFETQLAEAYGNEEERLAIMVEQKRAELDTMQQLEGESIEAFNLRKLEAQNAYLDAQQEQADREMEIQRTKYETIASFVGGLSDFIEQVAGDNKQAAQLAKVLAIAEIAISQGVAIANAVKTATSSSATWIDMLAAIGTVVASVTAVMGTAMKSVKSAKFAHGGLVQGPGTGTSDSIPAQLSNGESVLTANATSMFAPMLSAFNQMGGGVPISVSQSSNQSMGEDMLAKAVAKGMSALPAPVVSVQEISSVSNRVKVLENMGSV